jgi:hypothetical protein
VRTQLKLIPVFTKINLLLSIVDKKLPRYFEGSLKLFVLFQNFYLFIYLFIYSFIHSTISRWTHNDVLRKRMVLLNPTLMVLYREMRREYEKKVRCFRATFAALEQQYIFHILSVCLSLKLSSTQCACHIAICGPATLYNIFSTLSHPRNDFLEKKCYWILSLFFIFSTPSYEIFIIIRRTKGDIITIVNWSPWKAPATLVRF